MKKTTRSPHMSRRVSRSCRSRPTTRTSGRPPWPRPGRSPASSRRATTSPSRRRRWPSPRSRAPWTRSTPTPISSIPRASPACARTTRASTSASGMQIQKQGDNIVVIAPIEGGPAQRLGILPGRHHLPHRRRIDGADLELRRHAEAPRREGDRRSPSPSSAKARTSRST